MNISARSTISLFFVLSFIAYAGTCRGDILVNAIESNGDVLFSGGGFADLTALTFDTDNIFTSAAIEGSRGVIVGASDGNHAAYSGVSGPANFGTGSLEFASSFSGDFFGISDAFQQGTPRLFVEDDYLSGTNLSASWTFENETFNSLGITEGTYQWNWGSGNTGESFTLIIGVPEPGFASVLCLLSLALMRRRTR